MRPNLSSRFLYKARARSRARKRTKKTIDWMPATILVVGALALYSVFFPGSSGLWGRDCSHFLDWIAGFGRYAIPVAVIALGLRLLLQKEKRVNILKTVLGAGVFWAALMFLSLIGTHVWSTNFGGFLGAVGLAAIERLFGTVGSGIILVGIVAVLGVLLAGGSPTDLAKSAATVIKSDLDEWKRARGDRPKEKKAPVVPPAPIPPAPTKASQPKIQGLPPTKPPVIKGDLPKESRAPEISKTAEPARAPEIARKPAAAATAPATPASQPANAPAKGGAAGSRKPYKSPSLEIFDSVDRVKPVSEEELTGRARLLEQTLRNFNIAAQVVEIHPGPVITRYDLEPAPGVKVSSISSRADDLALAMKSIGIRVLAPIPGKGAVGVEIPNSVPERVGLRELLAKPEFYNHPSPLAFVLGKTVAGEPFIVDLAAMPHMLIAGSTGSGKSVVVHTLISSILYRMPPDLVKFTLIDPKRLELPSYLGMPHLYDPRVSPIDATVITNSKQAAKALQRLVKVMEYRYDLFAKANVRNIDSYNQKRKAAGEPPEYYLVVIIDELADLMLTAAKEVEDSIQRLAQMARAVGIHLVLATQRPSVDVITGVIKANLPARIALRVASSTDSRVIVDTVGAEILLGKGDMLFLPPASPDPVRIQGAFVSEKEVENLVAHIKQFGMPFYDDLFSSGSALEFAVEDKKEMKDLVEALKLVLERKRVSQDLLKAHFGSSARATNLLSLLEVKEFIKKPEGSNRWEINFDMIEEFLQKASNIPEQEISL